MIEALESRQLMSASLNASTGLLTVIGTDKDDKITFTKTSTLLFVNENEKAISAFELAKVKKIYANGKLGRDTIKVDAAITIPAELHGGGCEVLGNWNALTWESDRLYGGGGNDSLFDDGSSARLDGGGGNDYIKLSGDTFAVGGPGNDYLVKIPGTTIENSGAYGGEGVDTFSIEGYSVGQNIGNADDLYDQGIGWKGSNGGCPFVGEFENFRGGSGNDHIYGTAGKNTIHGGGGNDFIYGLAGNDTIYGDAGDDSITGGDGDDTIYGGTQNDYILGSNGNDTIFGEAGNDRLNGGAGFDKLFGGADNDYLIANDGYTHDLVDGGAGYDQATIDLFDTGSTGIEKFLT